MQNNKIESRIINAIFKSLEISSLFLIKYIVKEKIIRKIINLSISLR